MKWLAVRLAALPCFAHNKDMSDDPTTPKVTPRPANDRPRVKQAPQHKGMPATPESKFIGYVVLSFGILAVVAVFIVALNLRSGPAKQVATQNTQQVTQSDTVKLPAPESPGSLQARVAKDLSANFIPDPAKTAPPPPEPVKELYFKRQPGIKPADVTGAWQTQIGRYTAVLEITASSYQLILADPTNYSSRFYSSGTYSVIEDLFTLTPHREWAAPKSPPGVTVSYISLTASPFPVMAAIQKGHMLWQNPPFTEKRVLVPNSMPIMIDGAQRYLVWQRLK